MLFFSLYLDKFVFSGTKSQFFRRFHGVNAVSALNALNQMGFPGIGACIDQIHKQSYQGNGDGKNKVKKALQKGSLQGF